MCISTHALLKACVSIRQHMSAYVSHVSIRQHTSACLFRCISAHALIEAVYLAYLASQGQGGTEAAAAVWYVSVCVRAHALNAALGCRYCRYSPAAVADGACTAACGQFLRMTPRRLLLLLRLLLRLLHCPLSCPLKDGASLCSCVATSFFPDFHRYSVGLRP